MDTKTTSTLHHLDTKTTSTSTKKAVALEHPLLQLSAEVLNVEEGADPKTAVEDTSPALLTMKHQVSNHTMNKIINGRIDHPTTTIMVALEEAEATGSGLSKTRTATIVKLPINATILNREEDTSTYTEAKINRKDIKIQDMSKTITNTSMSITVAR